MVEIPVPPPITLTDEGFAAIVKSHGSVTETVVGVLNPLASAVTVTVNVPDLQLFAASETLRVAAAEELGRSGADLVRDMVWGLIDVVRLGSLEVADSETGFGLR